jgi:hypothetical protein
MGGTASVGTLPTHLLFGIPLVAEAVVPPQFAYVGRFGRDIDILQLLTDGSMAQVGSPSLPLTLALILNPSPNP